jgi:hypothetical protein
VRAAGGGLGARTLILRRAPKARLEGSSLPLMGRVARPSERAGRPARSRSGLASAEAGWGETAPPPQRRLRRRRTSPQGGGMEFGQRKSLVMAASCRPFRQLFTSGAAGLPPSPRAEACRAGRRKVAHFTGVAIVRRPASLIPRGLKLGEKFACAFFRSPLVSTLALSLCATAPLLERLARAVRGKRRTR